MDLFSSLPPFGSYPAFDLPSPFGSPPLAIQVYKAIKEWYPQTHYRNEEGYRTDLLNFLRKKFPKYIIKRENGPSAADISVNNREVGIEIKADLQHKSEADRLFGQVDDHLQFFNSVIVVLCGNTDHEQEQNIRGKLNRLLKGSRETPLDRLIYGEKPPKILLVVKR